MAGTVRYLSHGGGKGPSTLHNATGPTKAAGTILDIPDNSADGNVLTANGWSRLGYVGTTAQRPTVSVAAGDRYVDTTLGKMVVYDGVGWRDPSNGAAV